MEVKLQGVPYFPRGMCFGVQECLRDGWLVFLAQGNVKNLSLMLARVGYNRYASYVILASFLVMKQKVGSDKEQACTGQL